MSIAIWPSYLPQNIVYGSTTELDKKGSKTETDFEYGPSRRRNRFTFIPSVITISMFFTDSQIELFNSFYMKTLKAGTRFFYLKIPVGNSLIEHKCRFDEEALTISNDTYNRWSFKAKVEIWGRFTYSDAAIWLLNEYGFDFIESELANPLHTIVQVTWPTITENL